MVLQFLKSGFQSLQKAFAKSRSFFTEKLSALFSGPINEETFEELQALLYEADLGVQLSQELAKKTRTFLSKNPSSSAKEITQFLQESILETLNMFSYQIQFNSATKEPTVILVVGVNGSGKTTSVAKLAASFKEQGKSVLVAAADTFRAGAQEQLQIWAERIKVPCVAGSYKSDPAAVVFDACSSAIAKGIDIVIVDTAGRLENKSHLMQELAKIRRSCQKQIATAPHETLLVLDATIGQNGLNQAKGFDECTPLTGLILTKTDGTAKGGIALAIQKELTCPVKFVGFGETVADFAPFNPQAYVEALLYTQ